MGMNEIELEEQLKGTGTLLLKPPSDTQELLNLLDKMEGLLVNVEQSPSISMHDAILIPTKALISPVLVRHSDEDVRVSVASCISEVTRITAPEPPYSDDEMKEFFQLIVTAFEKLACTHMSSRCYVKAVSILDTIVKVRSCLIMLDLELDELVIEMFHHFLNVISPNHPSGIFCAMETIMTIVIDESEDISFDLLNILLSSVRKKNQNHSPMMWKLGDKVITNCAAQLKPYLKDAVQSASIIVDDYAPIVASMCQDECCEIVLDGLDAYVVTSRNRTSSIRNSIAPTRWSRKGNDETELEMEQKTTRKKRGWKPNYLMNPEEGYDHFWLWNERRTAKSTSGRKGRDKGRGSSSSRNPNLKKAVFPVRQDDKMETVDGAPKSGKPVQVSFRSPNQKSSHGRHSKKALPKADADHSLLSLSREKISDTQLEKASVTSEEGSLRKQSKSRCKSKSRADKNAEKAGLELDAHKTTSKLEPKREILNETDGNTLHRSAKVEVRCIDKDKSMLKCQKKSSILHGSLDENVALASFIKKAKLSGGSETCQEKTPKSQVKRKRTPRKEVDSKVPELCEDLIGTRIRVWWPLDKKFYQGVINSYDPIKKKHTVLYDDGDEETLNLAMQRWEQIGNSILSEKVLEPDAAANTDASLNMLK